MICEPGNLLGMREELPKKAEHSASAVIRPFTSAKGKQTSMIKKECCLEAMEYTSYLLVPEPMASALRKAVYIVWTRTDDVPQADLYDDTTQLPVTLRNVA